MRRMKDFRFSGGAALLAAFFLTLTGIFSTGKALAGEPVISKGVMIQDIDVGGLTKEEANAHVIEALSRLGAASVILNVEGQSLSATLSELGYS